MNSRRFSDC